MQYDKLIEATRAQVERNHNRAAGGPGAARRRIFALFPYPRRLRLLRGPLRAYQRSGLPKLVRRSGLLERLAPTAGGDGGAAPPRLAKRGGSPSRVAARAAPRARRVGLLTGCVQGEFFPGVNAATARVLAAEGCEVVVPRDAGLLRRAVGAQRPRGGGRSAFARRLIDAFERRRRGDRRGQRRRLRVDA